MSIVVMLFLCATLAAQGLFEEAEGGKDQENAYELNGYLRSTIFVGKVPEGNQGEIKSGYGEFSLKLKASKRSFGDAFAEVRFREGYEFNEYVSEINLREAYVNAYLGPFDFRAGHQIVAWGRADGMNPTDNITPKNMLVRSSNEDDRREANFLIRSFLNVQPVRLEVIWVPFFRSSVIPTNLLPFPPGITLEEPDYPETKLENSAFAVKLNLELASFDGSLSYFNGHNPFPGIDAAIPDPFSPGMEVSIFPKSYRMHVLGADFSTTVAGSFGLRGEVAYKKPHQDHKKFVHIPNPDFQYVLGLDKEFSGNFSVILQYIGRYVFDYYPLVVPLEPADMPAYQLALKNRMVTSQLYEICHSLSCRAGWNLLHETLKLELVGMVNITSEEYFLRSKMAYDIADALTFTLGGELYSGPANTLFDAIDSHLNALFAELKISF